MIEKNLVSACMSILAHELPRAVIYRVADRFTGGRPDLEVAWGGTTSYLEFKYLIKDETVHDKWEDARQLVTCVRLEQQTGRCWVVAYRKAYRERPDETIIYRPTKLLNRQIPEGGDVIRFTGFDHRAIAGIIRCER